MLKQLHDFIKPFQRHEKDNGSPEVQISSLTFEITSLQKHLKEHPQDVDAKRSLLKKVARRRKYLKYLKQNELDRFTLVSKKLKLKV
ncbi:30S ribosomal protein S15 [Candidatus Vampirococcus lugosii]|uniref:Small ribosomal subunit protein uS15 n=1 Tax=Candidatus Vampirococcus lugosii TaxID=2789015 RepID=A0ABS5QMD2_9BACT|nr:30S ribosomal protein S15 [Candidatus Vampirococcus lugosii]MBS8122366.1 30S ribosomal protein S15 [Candidatus Vampirococcus lugosii]